MLAMRNLVLYASNPIRKSRGIPDALQGNRIKLFFNTESAEDTEF